MGSSLDDRTLAAVQRLERLRYMSSQSEIGGSLQAPNPYANVKSVENKVENVPGAVHRHIYGEGSVPDFLGKHGGHWVHKNPFVSKFSFTRSPVGGLYFDKSVAKTQIAK